MHIINTNMYVAIVVDFVSIYTKLYYLWDFKVFIILNMFYVRKSFDWI